MSIAPPVQVRAIGKEQSPYVEELKKAEAAAQDQGLGVWSKVGEAAWSAA